MKRALFMLMIVLFIGYYVSSAQRLAIPKKPTPFRAMIWANNQLNHGFLKSISDTSLQLSQRRIPFTNCNDTLNVPATIYHYVEIYHYVDIEQMKVWKYGKVGKGIGVGVLAGAGIGAIIGLISYQKTESWFDFGPGFSAMTGAIIGAIPGAIIGIAIGTKKLKFNINGDKSNFNDMRTVILEKAL